MGRDRHVHLSIENDPPATSFQSVALCLTQDWCQRHNKDTRRKQNTKYRIQNTEYRIQKTKDKRRKPKAKRQKTKDKRQTSKDKRQKTNDKRQKLPQMCKIVIVIDICCLYLMSLLINAKENILVLHFQK